MPGRSAKKAAAKKTAARPRSNESAVTRQWRESAEQWRLERDEIAAKYQAHLVRIGVAAKEMAQQEGLCNTVREVCEQEDVPWPSDKVDFTVTATFRVTGETPEIIDEYSARDLIDGGRLDFNGDLRDASTNLERLDIVAVR